MNALIVQFQLPGSGLPVIERNVSMHFSNHDIIVCLLERNLLDQLGFNFQEYLKSEYNPISNVDMSGTVGNVESTYKGIIYRDHEDQPIPPPLDLSEQFGDDDPEEINKLLHERIEYCKKNGISIKRAERLWESMRKHKSIFGVKLVSHPPAKVKPHEVNLKPNARPVKAAQRRY